MRCNKKAAQRTPDDENAKRYQKKQHGSTKKQGNDKHKQKNTEAEHDNKQNQQQTK